MATNRRAAKKEDPDSSRMGRTVGRRYAEDQSKLVQSFLDSDDKNTPELSTFLTEMVGKRKTLSDRGLVVLLGQE